MIYNRKIEVSKEKEINRYNLGEKLKRLGNNPSHNLGKAVMVPPAVYYAWVVERNTSLL